MTGCWPQEDSSPQGSLGPAQPLGTLMREYHAVLTELEVWRDKKAQRMLQYERLQARSRLTPTEVVSLERPTFAAGPDRFAC